MPLRPLVCLIVEDQAPVAQALDVLFALHDVPTRVVADAESALQAVRENALSINNWWLMYATLRPTTTAANGNP